MKNNNKIALFALAPQRYGGLEILFPIINELHVKKYLADTWLFFSTSVKSYKQLRRDPFLKETAHNLFTKCYMGSSLYGQLLFLVFTFLNIIKAKHVIFLAPLGSTPRLIKILMRFNCITAIEYPKISTLHDDIENNDENNIPLKLNLNKGENQIGFPKFYKSWRNYTQTSFKSESLANNKKRVLIFLPSYLEDVFSYKELDFWLKETLEAIKTHLSTYEIVIKPHPMFKKSQLNILLSKHQNETTIPIRITYASALIELQNALLSISSHSSVILDSLAASVPTVFYQKFTDHWINRHPEKSYFLNLGATHLTQFNELNTYLKNKEYVQGVDRDSFLKKINHKDNLISTLKNKGIIT